MKSYHDLISMVFYPPVLDFFVVLIFVLFSPTGLGQLTIASAFAIGFIFLTVVPFLPLPIATKKGYVDLNVTNREKRTVFYLIALASYSVTAVLFYLFEAYLLFYLVSSFVIITLIVLFINMKWKISAHAAGLASPLTALVFVFGPQFLPLFGLLGVLGWSRVKMQYHTFGQVLVGSLISAAVTATIFLTYV